MMGRLARMYREGCAAARLGHVDVLGRGQSPRGVSEFPGRLLLDHRCLWISRAAPAVPYNSLCAVEDDDS